MYLETLKLSTFLENSETKGSNHCLSCFHHGNFGVGLLWCLWINDGKLLFLIIIRYLIVNFGNQFTYVHKNTFYRL